MAYETVSAASAAEEFVAKSTDLLAGLVQAAVAERGVCVMGLSGGSTPGPIYAALGAREDIPWSRVHVFLVDDRFIARDSPDSNQALLKSTLVAGGRVEHLVVPDTTLPTVEACAANYASLIEALFAAHGPPDVVTLGMGPDGHIASLFPPLTPLMLERTPCVVHTTTLRFAVRDRISLTLPTIAAARTAVVLMQGRDKAAVWDEMERNRDEGATRWPMKALMAPPYAGKLVLSRAVS